MTTTITAPTVSRAPLPVGPLAKLRWGISDTLTLTRRNLLAITRIPEALFFSTVQPIMFVLLFRYVFGGAISTPNGSYVNYLMPGVFVQTVAFGAVSTSIGLAEDLQKGLIERFRALPMSRGAVLTGRTTADVVRNVFVVIIITVVGFLVGFRPTTGVLAYLAGIGIILLFAYALSWGFAVIGLSAPNSETAQVMSFPILFPLIFVSSAFVPVEKMPSWLQGFATYQPVSVVITACRALMIGGPDGREVGGPVPRLDGSAPGRPHSPGRPPVPHPHLTPGTDCPVPATGQNRDMAHSSPSPDTFGARGACRSVTPHTRSSVSGHWPTASTSPVCPIRSRSSSRTCCATRTASPSDPPTSRRWPDGATVPNATGWPAATRPRSPSPPNASSCRTSPAFPGWSTWPPCGPPSPSWAVTRPGSTPWCRSSW